MKLRDLSTAREVNALYRSWDCPECQQRGESGYCRHHGLWLLKEIVRREKHVN